jgi:hypothetical protein
MARASTKTLIPLDRVAALVGIHPLHFNSVVLPSTYGTNTECDDTWFQYDYQDTGKFSREALAVILHEAESKAEEYLGYPPLPRWIAEEEIQITQPFKPELFNSGYRNARGAAMSVKTRRGHVLSASVVGKILIEDEATVVYSDEDGDGYDETATVTVRTDVTEAEEIHVFFPGKSGSDVWEIRPVDVVLDTDTSTATIVFPKHLAVLPVRWEAAAAPDNPSALLVDGDENTNFVSGVDVYRVYADTSQQAVLYFEPANCSAVGQGTSQTAVIYVRDSRRGIVTFYPATYDVDTEAWTTTFPCCSGSPQKLNLWYRAGLKNTDSDTPHLRMVPELEKLIVYYALSLADKTICMCNNINNLYEYQKEDLAQIRPESVVSSYQNTAEILNCPLGTTRAAVNLWRYILKHKI